ncbi:LRR receptor-like serine/threonine-protein kinase IOS1 isoform X2 [Carica papaya]|uniref:LRR receptor-like serine/threonine-protein kinase IOS1 isoform X2 n=1 Tax=Carica papaya TaxID=3649 RepID=UPI000B8CC221|nr:LRR receptor-like serine/threonine-protein kinase IOS1 isoform X2 [Carica papaya]
MKQTFAHFLFAITAVLVVRAQDQSGFISIDCGSVNTSYIDAVTSVRYISDDGFVEGGVSRRVAAKYQDQSLQQPLWNLRTFPQGTRNCYKVGIKKGNRYLIRAIFFYGDYDEKGEVPEFDLYLGPNLWETVQFGNESTILFKEIIHFTSSNFIQICLLNTGSGTPLISALELRKLVNNTYKTQSGSLQIFVRLNTAPKTDQIIRFPDDVLDRRWVPFHYEKWTGINTSLAVDSQGNLNYKPPPIVMSTAATPANSNESLDIFLDIGDPAAKFYVFMHFAELQELQANQFRQFNISWNGEFWFGPVVPSYLMTTTVFSPSNLNGGKHNFSIYKTQNSTLSPIINALELYMVKEFSQSETEQDDADAIMNIKSLYGFKRNWQGDPCAPQAYSWDGLNCSYNNSDPPRIISLNLASCGLTGDIPAYLSNLNMLEELDLSNNSLSGSVPDFFSKLPSLRVLNLSMNMLTGSIPEELIRKVEDGSLSLSVNENPNLCSSASCKKKRSLVIPLAASFATLFVLITALAIFWPLKRMMNGRKLDCHKNNKTDLSLESKNLKFTYNEIVRITDNFETVLGEGGFGKVYLGYLDNNEVAVKVLSLASRQGYEQFEAEVKILLRVHHRNLTALVGYCYEDTNMGLIYEYMANGDLKEHLSGKKGNILSWEERLQIATEAAQGHPWCTGM